MSSLRSFLFLFFTCLRIYDTSDNFTTKNFLKDDPESIVSYDGTLKPTYFSLSNTTNGGYVGSYYNKLPTMKDAWIANRNIPLTNGQKHVLSTNITVSHAAMSLYEAQHLESGHLVLLDSYNNNIKPSFDHVNTILPQVSLMYRKGNDKYSMIQACKSPSDPSQSIFLRPRSRLFNVNTLPKIDFKVNLLSHWITIQTDLRGNTTLMLPSPPFYELLDQGSVREPLLHGSKWIILRQAPGNECGIHRTRINGSGNLHSPVCKCLNGFKQSSGRPRTRPLLCGIQGGKEDGFSDANWSEGLDQDTCRSHCLLDRSCAAYAFDSGVGCYTQKFRIEDLILFRGLSDSRLGNNEKRKLITGVASISGTATLVAIVYFLCRRKAKQGKNIMLLDILNGNQRLDKFEELPLFKFDKLAAATSNFQDSNKIGQGGFGRVYKGTMEDGQEVAIKRLSETSRQGMEEFMNEALLISKLQHRNLVKLLGCCVERQERLLIYEYMPNKSLDAFIFDPNKKRILDWRKRYTIVEGICRGLLYLHRDSRLKIIHRDLKAANILLDEDLNPIISDFGMAKIFGTSQSEADTTRVAGTCGYMSPEYAFKGRFSEKSDVFSFGVLLLEIITGKRTRWHDDESSLSLVGYVWKQWTEDNIISLIDPLLAYQDFEAEISKCIHIGLLCVQENAQDRPDISAVILMLSALNTASFQKPNNPPGFTRLMCDTSSTPAQIHQSSSMNGLSISQISCR